MSPEFEDAFVRCAATAFEKQLMLNSIVGERAWEFDADSGKITFLPQSAGDEPLAFDVQILGSASQQSSTWRWAWANESVSENLASDSLLLSERTTIPEFKVPQLPIDFNASDDHRIAMTSVVLLSHLSGADAYYRGPYEGGAGFFILRDPRLELGPIDAIRISMVFPQVISNLTITNHRAAFLSYLEERRVPAQEHNDEVQVTIGNSSLNARFDNLNRLADIQVTARPEHSS